MKKTDEAPASQNDIMIDTPCLPPEQMMDSPCWWGVPTLLGAPHHRVPENCDIDCLDPAVAPAVSGIEADEEGLRINQAMTLLRFVRGKNIIGRCCLCDDDQGRARKHHGHGCLFCHVRDCQPDRRAIQDRRISG